MSSFCFGGDYSFNPVGCFGMSDEPDESGECGGLDSGDVLLVDSMQLGAYLDEIDETIRLLVRLRADVVREFGGGAE